MPSVAMPRGPRTFSTGLTVQAPRTHVAALGTTSRPPLSPRYRSGPMKARLKIGLWRVALAMNSTVGVAEDGFLTRAISVGAVVARLRKPTYTAPVAGSIAAAWACCPARPGPDATMTGLHTVS